MTAPTRFKIFSDMEYTFWGVTTTWCWRHLVGTSLVSSEIARMSNTYACNQPHQHYVCMKILCMLNTYACNQTRVSKLCVNIFYACQTHMLANVSTLCVNISIMHAKHICLQPTASTLCMKQCILCQPHMLTTKRINIMYECIPCMPSTYACNQTHQLWQAHMLTNI